MKFIKEHRVFTILMAVVLVCMVLIGTLLINLFYIGNGNDKYGNRLDDIVEISDNRITEIESNLATKPEVDNAKIIITGKIIYVKINFAATTDLETAKNIALLMLDDFSEEEKNCYDFDFDIESATAEGVEGFHLGGARNKKGSGPISWTNNKIVTDTVGE